MKRGQFWYGDFMIAVLILIVIGLLFTTSIIDITSRNEIIKELILDASDSSSVLMSEGSGDLNDWSEGKGTSGILTNYRIDENKINNFLNGLNYDQQKSMLGTWNNVWIYLSDQEGDIKKSNSDVMSFPIRDVSDITQNENVKNLVHIKRFVFWGGNEDSKADIYTLGVVVWQ